MTEPCDLTLREAADRLRARTLSSVELTRSVLGRLEQAEPHIHAYVEVLAEQALADATAADRALAAGQDRGAPHGIPLGVKDIFDLEGVPTRCGSRVREHAAPARADAVSVARARAAGAVFLGKTVTQEFAAGTVSPPARNPWDSSRIPGGSSGGSAAAVAAGSAMAAFGSDTGGSIRNPASVCGVVGLKPTFGSIDVGGVYPLAWSLDTLGPLTRSVEDAALFFDAIRDDRTTPSAASQLDQGLRGLRIGVERPYFLNRVHSEVAAAIENAARVLRGLGAEVVEVTWPEAELAGAAAFVINRVETAAVHELGLRKSPELYGDELRLRLEATSLYPATGYLRGLRARRLARESIARLYREHDLAALLVPACPSVAAPADDLVVTYEDGSREPVMLAYIRLTRPFNATGQPALTVPAWFTEAGLPIGIQIVGRPYDEATVCRIGHAFEREAGCAGRRPSLA
jgi:aspartyl-tRNA(Asn)/glutamyl-tRNA(Gln) amidotransferase subunit A